MIAGEILLAQKAKGSVGRWAPAATPPTFFFLFTMLKQIVRMMSCQERWRYQRWPWLCWSPHYQSGWPTACIWKNGKLVGILVSCLPRVQSYFRSWESPHCKLVLLSQNENSNWIFEPHRTFFRNIDLFIFEWLLLNCFRELAKANSMTRPHIVYIKFPKTSIFFNEKTKNFEKMQHFYTVVESVLKLYF